MGRNGRFHAIGQYMVKPVRQNSPSCIRKKKRTEKQNEEEAYPCGKTNLTQLFSHPARINCD